MLSNVVACNKTEISPETKPFLELPEPGNSGLDSGTAMGARNERPLTAADLQNNFLDLTGKMIRILP